MNLELLIGSGGFIMYAPNGTSDIVVYHGGTTFNIYNYQGVCVGMWSTEADIRGSSVEQLRGIVEERYNSVAHEDAWEGADFLLGQEVFDEDGDVCIVTSFDRKQNSYGVRFDRFDGTFSLWNIDHDGLFADEKELQAYIDSTESEE